MQAPEQDYHNFSTPSSHRLPTISGIEAIRNAAQNARPVSSGLPSLDAILGSSTLSQLHPRSGGLVRGQVYEVFGPPGVGRTAFALQVSVNAMLHSGLKVVWLSTGSPLVLTRLHQMLHLAKSGAEDSNASSTRPNRGRELLSTNWTYMQITNLPELLTLIAHPMLGFPPTRTALVVIDDLSNLLLSSLPRAFAAKPGTTTPQITPTQIRTDHAIKQANSRRVQVISSLASSLQAFAASRNVAILVTSNASANLRAGQKAVLGSALNSQQWNTVLGNRIALFRDFWPEDTDSHKVAEGVHELQPTALQRGQLRFAQVLKLSTKDVSTTGIGFLVEETGLREVLQPPDVTRTSILRLPVRPDDDPGPRHMYEHENTGDEPSDTSLRAHNEAAATQFGRKRKAFEIADSDEEAATELGMPGVILSGNRSGSVASKSADSTPPQSQVEGLPGFQTSKKLQFAEVTSHAQSKDEQSLAMKAAETANDAEMLLDHFEAKPYVPLFSQAAAEMSDPLTPSDDGHHSR